MWSYLSPINVSSTEASFLVAYAAAAALLLFQYSNFVAAIIGRRVMCWFELAASAAATAITITTSIVLQQDNFALKMAVCCGAKQRKMGKGWTRQTGRANRFNCSVFFFFRFVLISLSLSLYGYIQSISMVQWPFIRSVEKLNQGPMS